MAGNGAMEAIERKYVAPSGTTGMALAFLRLAKPGIVAAVLLAGYAGMATAARGLPDPRTAVICLGVLLLSAAGSAMLNSLLDAQLDRGMDRLQERVRALDTVGPARLLCVALACIASSLSLALALNRPVFLLVLAAAILYTLVYTLVLKRRFAWGAVPGGIPGALPVLIGQAAVTGSHDTTGILLFAVIFLWQPPHFWLLALRFRDDYREAGIPVLPVACGESRTRTMTLVCVAALLPATLALSLAGCCSPRFAVMATALWLWFLATCRHVLKTRRYEQAFRASVVYLALLLIAVILDTAIVH